MSKQTKAKSTNSKAEKMPAGLVWFEIPADDPARAKSFYGKLFGWKIEKFPGMTDYWHIDTGGADASPDGGMLKRKHAQHTITNYILVPSVNEFMARVEKLGGRICMARTAVPQTGYFAICQDTENNSFALWERDETAK